MGSERESTTKARSWYLLCLCVFEFYMHLLCRGLTTKALRHKVLEHGGILCVFVFSPHLRSRG